MRRWFALAFALVALIASFGLSRPTKASPASPAQSPRLVVFEFFSKHL